MPNLSETQDTYGPYSLRAYRNGVLYTSSDTQNLAHRHQRFRTSVVTPNYFSIMSLGRGQLPMNYFTFSRLEKSWGFGHRTETYSVWKNFYTGYFTQYVVSETPYSFSTLEKGNAYNGALTAARLKVKDQDFNVQVVIAEGAQTFELLAQSANRFRRMYSLVKKGQFGRAAKAVGVKLTNTAALTKLWRKDQGRAVSQALLELQYGWRPLLSDIYGGCVFLDKKLHGRIPPQRVASSKKLSYEMSTSSTSLGITTTTTWTSLYERKVVLYYELTSPTYATFASLGILNPVSVVWEKTKWSFVADWIAQISNFISQFDATVGWRYIKGSDTSFLVAKVEKRWTANGPSGSYANLELDVLSKIEIVENTRVGIPTEPITLFPYIKNPLGSEHAINAFALLHTNLKR